MLERVGGQRPAERELGTGDLGHEYGPRMGRAT